MAKKLSEEIATRKRSINFYSLGTYLPDPDIVLRKQGKDVRIYKELLCDPHVFACVQSRKAGVLYKTQVDNAANRPYWQYVAVLDANTRPEHAQLHDLVFPCDDAFWTAFYPPNGWRCRCRVRALSDSYVKKHNLIVDSSNNRLSEEERLVSKKSGEYKPVTVYTDPLTGKKIAPDVGWSYNPAADF